MDTADNDTREIENLQKKLGYRFREVSLLEAALTHRSFRYERPDVTVDNQRLEFLGDAVLGFIVSDWLYKALDGDEGTLTEIRSRFIKGAALSSVAVELGLGQHIRLGVGERRAAGHERASTLADTLEAVIGAIYLDGGIRACGKVIRRLMMPEKRALNESGPDHNPKGALQQIAQALWRSPPEYNVLDVSGPSHDRRFLVEVKLPDGTVGRGTGSSRRGAEVCAATVVLGLLRAREDSRS